MQGLMSVSRMIDKLNERVGRAVTWLVLVAVAISATNAIVRKVFNVSSNAYLEVQWYLFSAIFLLCAGYTLLKNEHVRIDVITSRMTHRTRAWIDVFGTVFFLLPMSLLVLWLSWPVFMNSWISQEYSSSAGGLIIWPARLLVPVGFLLLSLQGISELIKRVAYLAGAAPDPLSAAGGAHKPEEELVAAIKETLAEKQADKRVNRS